MLKKLLLIGLVLAFMGVPAFAGDRPEFDAVGDDSGNFFNDFIKKMVVTANPWNTDSDFTASKFPNRESFSTNANQSLDICFPGYTSYVTVPRLAKSYTWKIVLQMDPQSDLDINIRDCVLKNNATTAFGCSPYDGCEQTGRYTNPDGTIAWFDANNPRITIQAFPGPFAVDGFTGSFYLQGRTQPLLAPFEYNAVLFTSKCVWEEAFDAILPGFGNGGVPYGFTLSAGDLIQVKVSVPASNTTRISYGKDNVSIKYIGVCGTDLTASEEARQLGI